MKLNYTKSLEALSRALSCGGEFDITFYDLDKKRAVEIARDLGKRLGTIPIYPVHCRSSIRIKSEIISVWIYYAGDE